MLLEHFLRGIPERSVVSEEERIPFIPRVHAGPNAHPDFATRMTNEGKRSGSVFDKFARVGFEPDAYSASEGSFAFVFEAC
jgi:hypothetical protein